MGWIPHVVQDLPTPKLAERGCGAGVHVARRVPDREWHVQRLWWEGACRTGTQEDGSCGCSTGKAGPKTMRRWRVESGQRKDLGLCRPW